MSITQCPACGAALTVTAAKPWDAAPAFESSPLMVGASSGTYTRTTPTREPTPSGDVIVPLAQAGITAIAGSLVAIAASVANGWPWWVAMGAFALVFGLAWLYLLADHRALLRVTETITSQPDHEQAPDVMQPQPAIRLEVVEHHQAHSDTLRYLDLPCSEDAFMRIVQGVLIGRPLSESEWSGRGKLLSGPKFRRLQDMLLETGYIRYKSQADHRQGVELTGKGRALFTAIAGVEK